MLFWLVVTVALVVVVGVVVYIAAAGVGFDLDGK